MLILVCAYSFSLCWRVGLLRGKQAITCLRHSPDGSWHVCMRNQFTAVELRGESTVTPLVSVLRFRVKEEPVSISCVIFCDALSVSNAYRHLLVALRMR